MEDLEVLLTRGAERDLEDIHRYVTAAESPEAADRLLDDLLEVARRLSTFPERGTHPKELETVGNREYRQIVFGPYRVIYRVSQGSVLIYVVADGRRDFRSLLERRLLRP